MILGCVGSDSNRQSSAYEADELPFLYPAMGAAGGFEPRIQVMNLVSYLQTTTAIFRGMLFRSEPPRPHMKGNEPQSSGWQSGEYFIATVCNPF